MKQKIENKRNLFLKKHLVSLSYSFFADASQCVAQEWKKHKWLEREREREREREKKRQKYFIF